ncbi:hypothetical protein B0T10DRAFT_515723 [Thelonectria olida]|uniref:Uncharacterized protein n=1 Tax=Thelonectria olida TaxID=1576542 RepID=A0A9P8W0E9_9HYPO|nr:hypothetical protein B0T10DRAFT_515723 [Thelonectria olida]
MQLSYLTLLAWVAAHPVIAGPLDDICNAVEGVISCDRTIQRPIGSEPVYCDETPDTPCGVHILTEEIDICTAINNAMTDSEFVDNAPAICDCLAMAINDQDLKDVWEDGSLQGEAYPWKLDHAYYKETCLIEAGYKLKNNKQAAIGTKFDPKDGWKTLQAPEINVARYRALVTPLNKCLPDGVGDEVCNWADVRSWFLKWVNDAGAINNSDLAHTVKSWPGLIATLKKRIADVKSTAKTVQDRTKSVSTKVAAVQKKVCQKNACKGFKGPSASKFLNNVNEALKTAKALGSIPAESDKSANMIPKLATRANAAVAALKPNPKSEHWKVLIEKGEIQSFKSIMKGFGRLLYDLPTAASQIKSGLTHLILLTKNATRGKKAASQIKTVLAPKFKENQELSKKKAVRDGFIQIQTIIKNDLKGPVDKLNKAIDALNTDLSKLVLRGKKLELTYGSIGYDRFNNWDFDYPCVEMITDTYTEGEFSEDFTYPVYSQCRFYSGKVSFVRHWVPYLKYRWV